VLHIAFNMMWVRQLAPPVSELYGAYRMVVIYTLSGVSGFILSSAAGWFLWFLPGFLKGADFTVGASAAIFGLLGALLYYGRRGGSRFIGQQARVWAVVMLVYGFVMPGIDNWAHLGGLGGGYLAGAWLDPMKPERTDHLLMAIACLLLSLAAIVVSVVGGLSWTR
jgi:rhomboid protease GluP